jgi:hypothetical protein
MEGACVRCQMRSLDCGPKLPPQQRPRSITSVPAEYQRPLSLSIDTRLANVLDDYDTPLSAGSVSSNLHSLPVSPFMFPMRNHLEPYDPITPIGGSPVHFNLDTFEFSSPGYFCPRKEAYV